MCLHSVWKLSWASRMCTCSRRLHCGGSSRRSCGTLSPPAPSSVGCPSWDKHSTFPLRWAHLCGSTSARPRCPGGLVCEMAASFLVGEKRCYGWGAGICLIWIGQPSDTNLVGSSRTCRGHCPRPVLYRWPGSGWCCHWDWREASTSGWSERRSWRRRWGPEAQRALR